MVAGWFSIPRNPRDSFILGNGVTFCGVETTCSRRLNKESHPRTALLLRRENQGRR